MEDKTKYEALVEELQKIMENFRDGVIEIGERLSKILPDIEIPDEEEDTWKMKCPYKDGDEYWFIYDNVVDWEYWEDTSLDTERFDAGNVFSTEEAALLEAKRRNLLTRFRAFRDECNGDWKADFKNKTAKNEAKWNISYYNGKLQAACTNTFNDFVVFGYFKKKRGALRAIELFGDEIKALFVDCEVQ